MQLITTSEAAEMLGFSEIYFRSMTNPSKRHFDSTLVALRIETDETWRKAYESKAQVVYDVEQLKQWFADRGGRLR